MNEVSIEIQLANRKYPLRIHEKDVDVVFKAAELVNAKLKEFEEKYQIRDIQDLYAMSALQLAVQYTDKQEPHPISPENVKEKIVILNGLLEASLAGK